MIRIHADDIERPVTSLCDQAIDLRAIGGGDGVIVSVVRQILPRVPALEPYPGAAEFPGNALEISRLDLRSAWFIDGVDG
jgi:hypothetical protein